MNEIRSIDGAFAGLNPAHTTVAVAGSAASGAAVAEDSVEISDLARVLQEAWDSAVVRQDRIDELRAAISRGDYVTNEKLDVAIERALNDL